MQKLSWRSLCALFLFILHRQSAISISETELDALVSALRSRGYNLFPNALMTSNIRLELLSGQSFTLFAPTDSSILTLQMTSSPELSFSTLCYHIIPRYFTYASLRALPTGSTIPTLLPDKDLLLVRVLPDALLSASDAEILNINGVDLIVPGIFYGANVAVHGLNGILPIKFHPKIAEPGNSGSSQFLDGSLPGSIPILHEPDKNQLYCVDEHPLENIAPSAIPTDTVGYQEHGQMGFKAPSESPSVTRPQCSIDRCDDDATVSYAGDGAGVPHPHLSIGFD